MFVVPERCQTSIRLEVSPKGQSELDFVGIDALGIQDDRVPIQIEQITGGGRAAATGAIAGSDRIQRNVDGGRRFGDYNVKCVHIDSVSTAPHEQKLVPFASMCMPVSAAIGPLGRVIAPGIHFGNTSVIVPGLAGILRLAW